MLNLQFDQSMGPKSKRIVFLYFQDIFVHESVNKSSIQTIEQLFPIGSQCFMLAAPHYGAQGEVLEVDVNQGRVRVQLKVPTEPNINPVMMQREVHVQYCSYVISCSIFNMGVKWEWVG